MYRSWLKFGGVAAVVTVLGGPWGLALLAGILLVVLGHELGHLAAAKVTGCVASDVSVGFGPVLVQRRGKQRWYRLRAYPLGGFVSLQPDPDSGIDGIPMDKMPPGRRFVIAVAGPIGSFLSAAVLLALTFSGVGFDVPTTTVDKPAGSLMTGDIVLEVDGRPVSSGMDLYTAGDTEVLVDRGGTLTSVALSRSEVAAVRMVSQPERLPLTRGVPLAFEVTGRTVVQSVVTVAKIPSAAWGALSPGSPDDLEQRPVSVIGVVQGTTSVTDLFGVAGLFLLVAQLSVTLGVFNLLPVPPLDGGHAAIAIIESVGSKVRRRPVRVPEQIVNRIALASMISLLTFAAGIMILDVLFPVF